MASLKDIATALNLSIPLVSKVLSGRMGTTGCSEANRLAILAKAEELGFKPNLIARALRTGRTGSVGVFVHPLGAPGSDLIERMLMGLSTQANICDQRLWLSFYETDNDFLHRFTKTARAEIDGLLVAGVYHPRLARLYKAIEKNGIPVVTMFKNASISTESVNVFCDDFQIGYLPTRHLLDRGCRNIAHIRSLDIRYEGYLKAIQDFGLQEDPALVYTYTAIEKFGANTGKEAVQHWIANKVKFDGVVAESDHQAFGAVTELLNQGLRVPDDVKVFGVDDSPVCALSPVPLSSVSQRVEEIGTQAVNTLMKRINGEEATSLTIQPVLRLRTSSGN
jgi:LacI family transcriptional regulator